jgi:hypothetical protein
MSDKPVDPQLLKDQVRLSRMPGMGFVMTIGFYIPVGSVLALVIGIRALLLIRRSPEPMAGRLMAWWCTVIGSMEVLFFLYFYFWKVTE